MTDFITLDMFRWGVFLLCLALIFVALVVKYYAKKRKEDYTNRDDYVIDDFYMHKN